MVLGMYLEVLGQVRNLFAENRYLYLGRSGIRLVGLIRIDDFRLSFNCK